MRIARFVTMRRKGHNGISFLAGHFGEPRRKLRLTTKLLSQCPSTASFSLYVLGRRINAVQFAETRTISILNYDYLRDSRRVPFIWRSGSRSIPHHLPVFPFIYELHEREYWFSSLFNPNQWSKHSKDSVDSRVILYRGEIDWFSWKIRENRGWIRLERLGEERITRYTTCKILNLMNEVTSFFYKISKDFLFGI